MKSIKVVEIIKLFGSATIQKFKSTKGNYVYQMFIGTYCLTHLTEDEYSELKEQAIFCNNQAIEGK